jgi:hypothetical protein
MLALVLALVLKPKRLPRVFSRPSATQMPSARQVSACLTNRTAVYEPVCTVAWEGVRP